MCYIRYRRSETVKNVLKFSVLTLGVIAMAGCGAKEDYTLKCTLEQNDVINNYKTSSTYEITTDGEIAKKVKTTEIITSENEPFLDTVEENLHETYNSMNEAYGGYTIDITKEDGKITSVVEIDYTTLDIESLLEDQPSMKSYANDKNQMTLEGIKGIYTAMGATCEE